MFNECSLCSNFNVFELLMFIVTIARRSRFFLNFHWFLGLLLKFIKGMDTRIFPVLLIRRMFCDRLLLATVTCSPNALISIDFSFNLVKTNIRCKSQDVNKDQLLIDSQYCMMWPLLFFYLESSSFDYRSTKHYRVRVSKLVVS